MPEARVSPTPRSKIRALTLLPSIARKETLVRLGNSSWASISGPISAQVEVVELGADDDRALRVADRDVLKLPIAPRGAERPLPSSGPEGKSFEAVEARPISTAQVSSPVIVGTIGPASVLIAKVSSSVQPWRRR